MAFSFAKYSIFLCIAVLMLSGCSQTKYATHLVKQIPLPGDTPETKGYFKVGSSYKIKGRRYYPRESYNLVETGIASWYGPGFHGKMTANGEIFDENKLTAAHRTLQMPSLVRVTNLENGKSLVVRVNDRGPFAHERIIDLSKRGAELLGFKKQGIARVKVEVLGPESRAIASAAKRGESTSGTEIAMNRYGRLKGMDAYTYDAMGTPPPLPERKPGSQFAMNSYNPATPPNISQPLQVRASRPPQPTSANSYNAMTSPQGTGHLYPARKPVMQPTYKQNHAFPRNEAESIALQDSMNPALTPSSERFTAQGHMEGQRFMPDPVVTRTVVVPTSLYVQVGSFTYRPNAQALQGQVSNLGQAAIHPVNLQGTTFYRVRFGPYQNVEQADSMLKALDRQGKNGTIIVVQQ